MPESRKPSETKTEAKASRPDQLAPENFNDEQEDEGAQAHTLAAEARGRSPGDYGSPTESVKRKSGGDDLNSRQDLVDHMRDMERSGRIDMGAYRGEANMDDDEDKYGEENRLDDD